MQQKSSATQPGENQLIWTVWLTYGAFYFCRTNISAAIPGLKESMALGDFGDIPNPEIPIGYILASWKLMYGAGQFINGQFSERLSPRVMLGIGMLGSAVLSVLFGFSTAVYFLLFVWACNGFLQSLGWTPCVRVLANWIPISRRGHAIGIVGTGYQLTAVLTFIIAGLAADAYGWQGAMIVPAFVLLGASLVMFFFLEEHPRKPQAEQLHDEVFDAIPSNQNKKSFYENLSLTLTNPSLWALGISLGLLNACRYGFLDWGLTHLIDVQRVDLPDGESAGVGKAALKYAVLPLGGIVGAYFTGWATDRFLGGRRAPMICILLALLGVLTLQYDAMARTSVIGTLVLLAMIGFCIYGPQVLLVGTAPADLARKGSSAAAAGFVNCMGYIGAASGDIVTGHLLAKYDWEFTIYVWAGWAFAAALISATLWNATARPVEAQTTDDDQTNNDIDQEI